MRPIPLLLSLFDGGGPGPWLGALGLAPWMPVLLVLAGLLFLAVEIFLGQGAAAVVGLLAIIAGIVLAGMGPGAGVADLAITGGAVVASLTLIGLAGWALVTRVKPGDAVLGGRLRRDEGYVAALPRPELEGLEGVALTDLRPAGTAEVAGERLDVVSEAGWITAGTPVRILHAEGYRHVVRALPPSLPRETPSGG